MGLFHLVGDDLSHKSNRMLEGLTSLAPFVVIRVLYDNYEYTDAHRRWLEMGKMVWLSCVLTCCNLTMVRTHITPTGEGESIVSISTCPVVKALSSKVRWNRIVSVIGTTLRVRWLSHVTRGKLFPLNAEIFGRWQYVQSHFRTWYESYYRHYTFSFQRKRNDWRPKSA